MVRVMCCMSELAFKHFSRIEHVTRFGFTSTSCISSTMLRLAAEGEDSEREVWAYLDRLRERIVEKFADQCRVPGKLMTSNA